jgi:transposase
MWVPPEEVDPVSLHAPTHQSAGVMGAVRCADGTLVARPAHPFNAESFLEFVKCLWHYHRPGRIMLVVVDNARFHHARLLTPWLKEHRREFRLDFLPPYSPELNAMERVWKLTRRLCTHNRYFPILEELVDTIFSQFNLWSRPNETLRRLCAVT